MAIRLPTRARRNRPRRHDADRAPHRAPASTHDHGRAFLVMAVVAFLLYNPILHALQRPYCQVNPRHCAFYVTAPLDGLSLRIKIGAFGGLVLASPIIFWQFWRFITRAALGGEALRRALRGGVHCLVPGGLRPRVLHLPARPRVLEGIAARAAPDLQPQPVPGPHPAHDGAVRDHLRVPVVLVSLELLGVVTPKKLLSWWRWAVIGIASPLRSFTPSSDPFSMLALAVPLTAFYFVSIAIGKILGR